MPIKVENTVALYCTSDYVYHSLYRTKMVILRDKRAIETKNTHSLRKVSSCVNELFNYVMLFLVYLQNKSKRSGN